MLLHWAKPKQDRRGLRVPGTRLHRTGAPQSVRTRRGGSFAVVIYSGGAAERLSFPLAETARRIAARHDLGPPNDGGPG